jgi:hypothetical protein
VFKYPLDRSKSFIKRIVGIPGEDLEIRNGDVFTRPRGQGEFAVLRKTDPVQDAVWKRIHAGDPRYSAWRTLDGSRGWAVEGRARIAARGDGAVQLPSDGGTVYDNYRDGYPGAMGAKLVRAQQFTGTHPVADLRLTGKVTALPGTRRIVIELREGRQVHRFEIPGPAAEADARPRIAFEEKAAIAGAAPDARGEAGASSAWRLEAGRAVTFEAQNVDDRLRLALDGEVVASLDVPETPNQASNVTLRVEGEGADFDDLDLWRDIYYTNTRGRVFEIPDGHYVMLGDNTQDSSDSREWSLATWSWNGADAQGQSVRGNYFPIRGPEAASGNPIVVPGGGDGARMFFRDEWGELHTFLLRDATEGPRVDAPYVPRELVVGRAVLVFWPLWPFTGDLGIWRLQFVR